MSDILSQIDVCTLKGLTQDSRAVKAGYLFAALPGSKVDGRNYIADAIQHGATHILAPAGTELPPGTNAIMHTSSTPRRDLAKLAAAFYGRQPAHIVAVTGTNGKTSTALFVEQLWKVAGYRSASLGTLGLRIPGAGEQIAVRSGSMTTPDPVSLHAELADLAAAGISHLAIEASSHGLDQYRLDGLAVEAGGFTNLSRDHLDYHKDMESYLDAKARLFKDIVSADGVSVLNADTEQFETLKTISEDAGHTVVSYGFNGGDLHIQDLTPTAHGQALKLKAFGEMHDLQIPLVGAFQVMNALCALGLVAAKDPANASKYIAALENLSGAPGRLQLVPNETNAGHAVYVDYAHTPDALEHVLNALRPHTTGRLICVFGCGGDRDKGKRSVMGGIAARLSDILIVTDDNPRTEAPEQIRREILDAADTALEIGDRRKAIQQAVNELNDGDVLLIAGKGHEQGQIFADRTEAFDDVTEAQTALKLKP